MALVEVSVTKASGAVGCGLARRAARDECVVSGNRTGALDFRAGKDVGKSVLDGGCVWKKTPIEI